MVGYAKSWIRKARWATALGVLLLAAPLRLLGGSPPFAKNYEASIPFANHGGIREWRADGSKGLWIQAAGGHWFYASFSSQCTTLPFAIGVRFVPEPSGVLSRWSSIRLAHDERCFFRTLQPSDAPPKKDETAKPAATPGTVDKPAPAVSSHESSPTMLKLAPPPLQVLLDDRYEPRAAPPLPEIVVEAGASVPLPATAAMTSCGIASIAGSLAHPADAWRELAPLSASADADECLRSATIVEHVPEALAPVRWYE